MKKILLIHDTLDPMGGAEILFLDNVKLLRKLGFEVASFSFTRNEGQEGLDYRFKESVFFTPKRMFGKVFFNYKAYKKLKKIINNFKPDLIHIYHNHLYPLSVLSSLPSSVPVIQSINDYQLICASCWGVNKKTGKQCECGFSFMSVKNGCLPWYRFLTFFLKEKLARNFTKKKINLFLVTHSDLKKKLEKQKFVPVRILPHFFAPNREINSSKITKRDHYNILFIAKLSKEKGCHVLIDAMKKIHQLVPEAKLTIIGDGPEEKNLKNQVFNLGLTDYVKFIGRVGRKELPKYYKNSALLIIPSIWMENSGLVAIEAASFGLPVVASKVGGLQDLVQDGKTGFLFKAGNIDSLAEKTTKILTDKPLREKIRQKAKEFSRQFTPESYNQQLMEIYSDLIAKKK